MQARTERNAARRREGSGRVTTMRPTGFVRDPVDAHRVESPRFRQARDVDRRWNRRSAQARATPKDAPAPRVPSDARTGEARHPRASDLSREVRTVESPRRAPKRPVQDLADNDDDSDDDSLGDLDQFIDSLAREKRRRLAADRRRRKVHVVSRMPASPPARESRAVSSSSPPCPPLPVLATTMTRAYQPPPRHPTTVAVPDDESDEADDDDGGGGGAGNLGGPNEEVHRWMHAYFKSHGMDGCLVALEREAAMPANPWPDSMWDALFVERRADPTAAAQMVVTRVPPTFEPEFEQRRSNESPAPVVSRRADRAQPGQDRNNQAALGISAREFASLVYNERLVVNAGNPVHRRQRHKRGERAAWTVDEEKALLAGVSSCGDHFHEVKQYAAPTLDQYTRAKLKAKWQTFLRSSLYTPERLGRPRVVD